MKYGSTELCNGNTNHLLLSPRFDVSNRNLDYRWLEVEVTFEPLTGRSFVDVSEIDRTWRLIRFGAHGGIWPFPGSMDSTIKTHTEHEMLRSIMRSLNDPASYITEWGKVDE